MTQVCEFSQGLAIELQNNRQRCQEIAEATRALEAELRAIEDRRQALEVVEALFQSSQQVVDEARTTQARLNPAALYQSSQDVVDQAVAAGARMNSVGRNPTAGSR